MLKSGIPPIRLSKIRLNSIAIESKFKFKLYEITNGKIEQKSLIFGTRNWALYLLGLWLQKTFFSIKTLRFQIKSSERAIIAKHRASPYDNDIRHCEKALKERNRIRWPKHVLYALRSYRAESVPMLNELRNMKRMSYKFKLRTSAKTVANIKLFQNLLK